MQHGLSFVLAGWLAWAPLQVAAQTLDSSRVVDAGIEYFRQARYDEALALLSTADALFDESGDGGDLAAPTKFYLALAHAALGNAEDARSLFVEIYRRDLRFEPPEPPPTAVSALMEETRATIATNSCPTSCVGIFTNWSGPAVNPGCQCFEPAIATEIAAARGPCQRL